MPSTRATLCSGRAKLPPAGWQCHSGFCGNYHLSFPPFTQPRLSARPTIILAAMRRPATTLKVLLALLSLSFYEFILQNSV